jgi:acyl-coenzyme A synthetase/AMP-(fatty) acid ligase
MHRHLPEQAEIQGQAVGEQFTNGTKETPAFPNVTAAILHHICTIPADTAIIDLAAPTQRCITYGELGHLSSHLANVLRKLGVGPGDRVPLIVSRGIDMVIGILAILRCGAQYVPLDGNLTPKVTVRRVIEQSAGKTILCLRSTLCCLDGTDIGQCQAVIIEDEAACSSSVDHCKHAQFTDEIISSESGCYVIYTSGKFTYTSTSGRYI